MATYGVTIEENYAILLDELVNKLQKTAPIGSKITKHSLCKQLLERGIERELEELKSAKA